MATVTIDQVLTHNKISMTIDPEFAQEHINNAQDQIDRVLGTSFVLADADYPELYYEAIKKQAYIYMIPFLHLFYQQDYPEQNTEQAQYYLNPAQQKATIGLLQSRVNECLDALEVEVSYDDNDKVLVAGGFTFMAAGGNPKYIPKYRNRRADNDDKK